MRAWSKLLTTSGFFARTLGVSGCYIGAHTEIDKATADQMKRIETKHPKRNIRYDDTPDLGYVIHNNTKPNPSPR